MANDQISLDEYLAQNNARVEVEDYKALDWKWEANPIEQLTINGINPLTTYSSGTSHPSYGAMPNVTIGSGINVSPTVWTTNTTAGQYSFTGQNIQPNNTVHIKGKDADLLINDKSLKTWMEKVEERLNILTPNPEMEKEWDQLRKLGERYRKLEKKCKEKSDMWNKLKAMPKPEIK
jgi:hypothetical protein